MQASRSFRFFLIFVLAMTEYTPVAFLSSAMPVILRRSGASMSDLGFLSLVMMPFIVPALPTGDGIVKHPRADSM